MDSIEALGRTMPCLASSSSRSKLAIRSRSPGSELGGSDILTETLVGMLSVGEDKCPWELRADDEI